VETMRRRPPHLLFVIFFCHLKPKKKIYMTLTDLYTNETIDLYAAVSADSTRSQRNLAISNIKSLVENLIYDISSIQVCYNQRNAWLLVTMYLLLMSTYYLSIYLFCVLKRNDYVSVT